MTVTLRYSITPTGFYSLLRRWKVGELIDTGVVSKSARPLRFGASLNSLEDSPTVDGDLDEFYLFRGALTEAEIGQLMRGNRLGFFVK